MGDTKLLEYLPTVIVPAIVATIKIIFFSALFSILFGLFFGIILFITKPGGLKENKAIHIILERITDTVRAFPTMILIVALAPLTRLLIGTAIGPNAAIFAIIIACTPFATRMTENSLESVDSNLIKAAKSFGASDIQIITKVLLSEALPSLISNFTILLINMLNVSTIAGAVGAGGLGAVALTYGYQRFDYAIMYFVVAILLIIVLLIQMASKKIYLKLK